MLNNLESRFNLFLWKVPEEATDTDLLPAAVNILASIKPRLYEYHTRAMRNDFFKTYGYFATVTIPPYILRSIYICTLKLPLMQLHRYPEIDGRVRLAILSEERDMIVDLRHLNKGRPNDTFNIVFDYLEREIQDLIAADERRHNVEHISKYITSQKTSYQKEHLLTMASLYLFLANSLSRIVIHLKAKYHGVVN